MEILHEIGLLPARDDENGIRVEERNSVARNWGREWVR
uniref:Uncharacterized protein n=1 Tax=Rhizobium rhizogenes TaxID=359 RepID=A0A7S4ZTE3_RHIRH|nr:hypothetical protein pC6.5b_387 [Rhizobium rhizogenes]